MSAFMVGTDHVDCLLTAGLIFARPHGPMVWQAPGLTDDPEYAEGFERGNPWGPLAQELSARYRRELSTETADAVGAMLLAENAASVGHRYDEDEFGHELEAGIYRYRALPGHPVAVIVLKALSCYEYQSCEHPGWEASEAHAFCATLRDVAINNVPGYREADGWEVRSRDVFRSYSLKGATS